MGRLDGGAALAPDWVCEVVSPSTAALDRTRKMRHYARAQVRHIWLLDPAPETLEVFRPDGEAGASLAASPGRFGFGPSHSMRSRST
jgi:Uma2 family endonuclease